MPIPYAPEQVDSAVPAAPTRLRLLSGSALFFALLQSVCSAFVALSGVRLLIGLSAFAAATSVLRIVDRLHVDAIRIPMTVLALLGSVWNLVALWRVWRLRRRSASAWRQRPVSKPKKRSEALQFILSVATLLLLAIEAASHHSLFHHF